MFKYVICGNNIETEFVGKLAYCKVQMLIVIPKATTRKMIKNYTEKERRNQTGTLEKNFFFKGNNGEIKE